MSVAQSSHPSLLAITRAREAIAVAGQRDPIFLSPAEHATVLSELVALGSQVAELQARVTVAATPSGVDDSTGTHDVTAWIASALGLGHAQARSAARFAERLDVRTTVAAAMRTGALTLPQADVITRSLDALPHDLDPSLVAQAEFHLVALAENHGPKELRVLGRRILEVVAPDIAEAAEAAALEREERTAQEKTRLSLRFPGDGTFVLRAVGPELAGIRLANFLNAITNPRRHCDEEDSSADLEEVARKLPHARKLGQAFCELLERIDTKTLPDHGSMGTDLIVTMSLEALRTDLAAATAFGPDGATPISASEARRLACNAGIIPAVLGTKGQVLDLGRATRLASGAQRRALMLAHSECQAEHCDRPAPWCEAHHLEPWEHGGATDLRNMALLCSQHHHRLHHHDYTHERLPDGTIRFTRRC